MILASRWNNEKGVLAGFRCEGHAGYARRGKDIVCAAVSVLAINTVNSIQTFTNDKCSCIREEAKGLIEFRVKGEVSKESQLLLRSFFLALESIEREYGNRYLTVR